MNTYNIVDDKFKRKWLKTTKEGEVVFCMKNKVLNSEREEIRFYIDEKEDLLRVLKREFDLFDRKKVISFIISELEELEQKMRSTLKQILFWSFSFGLIVGFILTKLVF
jgi:hypothetical protein